MTLLGFLGRRDAPVKVVSIDPTIVSQNPIAPVCGMARLHSGIGTSAG
jgi:hypothetical protein